MYKLEILTVNQNADGKFFSAWLKENYRPNFVGSSTGFKVVLTFTTEPTEAEKNEIETYYSALTVDDLLPSSEIIAAFEQMQVDGKDYFFQAKAKYFGLRYKIGDLTDANINYCYHKLDVVANRLNNGDWVPALYIMQNEINTITQQDIDNGYTQEIHDEIVQDLTNYISTL
jgi:hypothetical protein